MPQLIPKLILLKGEQLLTEPEYIIGRHKRCQICFRDDPSLSRYHATIFKDNDIYCIKDGRIGRFNKGKITDATRSSNGTYVNGVKLDATTDWKKKLIHNDKIVAGKTTLIFWFPILDPISNDEDKETIT